jgi:uncharacterized protein YndB with AHSA1/START domain
MRCRISKPNLKVKLMNNEKFVYVTYIATALEKVWQALVQGDLSRQWWQIELESDWQAGSGWRHIGDDEKRTVKRIGTVLESIPNQRLVYTWITPEHAADKTRHSKVSIDLEAVGEKVRLTVTHEDLTAEGLKGISYGWPLVLSSLKSFLETGKPLVFSTH